LSAFRNAESLDKLVQALEYHDRSTMTITASHRPHNFMSASAVEQTFQTGQIGSRDGLKVRVVSAGERDFGTGNGGEERSEKDSFLPEILDTIMNGKKEAQSSMIQMGDRDRGSLSDRERQEVLRQERLQMGLKGMALSMETNPPAPTSDNARFSSRGYQNVPVTPSMFTPATAGLNIPKAVLLPALGLSTDGTGLAPPSDDNATAAPGKKSKKKKNKKKKKTKSKGVAEEGVDEDGEAVDKELLVDEEEDQMEMEEDRGEDGLEGKAKVPDELANETSVSAADISDVEVPRDPGSHLQSDNTSFPVIDLNDSDLEEGDTPLAPISRDGTIQVDSEQRNPSDNGDAPTDSGDTSSDDDSVILILGTPTLAPAVFTPARLVPPSRIQTRSPLTPLIRQPSFRLVFGSINGEEALEDGNQEHEVNVRLPPAQPPKTTDDIAHESDTDASIDLQTAAVSEPSSNTIDDEVSKAGFLEEAKQEQDVEKEVDEAAGGINQSSLQVADTEEEAKYEATVVDPSETEEGNSAAEEDTITPVVTRLESSPQTVDQDLASTMPLRTPRLPPTHLREVKTPTEPFSSNIFDDETREQVLVITLDEPPITPTSPATLKLFSPQPKSPPEIANTEVQYPGVLLPLARVWVLYYSSTGFEPATARAPLGQPPNFASDPMVQVLVQGGRMKGAEEFSHGLFELFRCATVEDFIGTWKALRRKIAHAKGRPIEPVGEPIGPNAEGLGIGFLNENTNFHFFVRGVKPMWEDKLCARGGKVMLAGNPVQVSHQLSL
jgi:hypothetical protein